MPVLLGDIQEWHVMQCRKMVVSWTNAGEASADEGGFIPIDRQAHRLHWVPVEC